MGNLQPVSLTDRPVTGPRQSTMHPQAQTQGTVYEMLQEVFIKTSGQWWLLCCLDLSNSYKMQ